LAKNEFIKKQTSNKLKLKIKKLKLINFYK